MVTHFSGVAQKGPFIRGSTVVISELDATLAQTGRTFVTEIADDSGAFDVRVEGIDGPYAKLTANGFYFDEVLGRLSAAPLTLHALVPTGAAGPPDVSAFATGGSGAVIDRSARVNANALTELETPRVAYLVDQGTAFSAAKRQAQREIFTAFLIDAGTGDAPSESLDILHGSAADAALLAISVLLQGYLGVAELSELLSKIGDDLRTDGQLDDVGARALIKNAATLVSTSAVRDNVIMRYAAVGIAAVPGDFASIVTHYRDESPDAYFSRVKYPATGMNGPNLLSANGDPQAGNYSVVAVAPAGQPLTVRCTSLSAAPVAGVPRQASWSIGAAPSPENWSVSGFDVDTGVQTLTVQEPGRTSDALLRLAGTGSMRVEVLEGDATVVTSTRTLRW